MIDSQLPVLQVIIPLLAAPLCVLVRTRNSVIGICIVTCGLAFACAWRLLFLTMQLTDAQFISYDLGGWPAPYGIEYRVDTFSAFMAWLVSGMGLAVICYSPKSVDREIPADRHYLFYTLYLLCLTGLLGIVVAGDLFNLFVFLEISSLSTYAMVTLGRTPRALLAAFQYLIMGTIGATFFLIGVGLSYQMTGTLNMTGESVGLAPILEQQNNRTVLVSFAFMSVGLSIKIALFPLHRWLPNAYACAPSVVTAFIAATATKVSVYALVRIIFDVFKPSFAFITLPMDSGLMFLSLLGIYVASTTAIFQQDVKRMLAFSSVAQIGYIVLGISFASVTGLTAGIVHLLNHAVIKGGLFMAMGCFAMQLPTLRLENLNGIGRRMPYTMFAWVLGGLGLIGVPLTAGFISKWYLIEAALESGFVWLAVVILLSSLLSVAYVWRVVEVAYFRAPSETSPFREAPLGMLIPTYILIGLSLLLGIWTTYSVGIASRAAMRLIGVDR